MAAPPVDHLECPDDRRSREVRAELDRGRRHVGLGDDRRADAGRRQADGARRRRTVRHPDLQLLVHPTEGSTRRSQGAVEGRGSRRYQAERTTSA